MEKLASIDYVIIAVYMAGVLFIGGDDHERIQIRISEEFFGCALAPGHPMPIGHFAPPFDIGIGGSGSETVLIPDVAGAHWNSEVSDWYSALVFGVDVPSGSRLSGRWSYAAAGGTMCLTIVGV